MADLGGVVAPHQVVGFDWDRVVEGQTQSAKYRGAGDGDGSG